jgi:Flp pilus assembly protein TadG
MKTTTSAHANERGHSMVLIGLILAAVIAVLGLALTGAGGQSYLMRQQMQNAADSAALAAVVEMVEGQPSLVSYRVNQYAIGDSTVGNGATKFSAQYLPSNVEVTATRVPPSGTQCVKVTAYKTDHLFGITFLGMTELESDATATACVDQLSRQ